MARETATMTKLEEWRALAETKLRHIAAGSPRLPEDQEITEGDLACCLREVCDEVERLNAQLAAFTEHHEKRHKCDWGITETEATAWIEEHDARLLESERTLRRELAEALGPFARWANQSPEAWWKNSNAPLVANLQNAVLSVDDATVQSLHRAAAVFAKARELDAEEAKVYE